MKCKILLPVSFFLLSITSVFSYQTSGKTIDGRNITLESNGTWKYEDVKIFKKNTTAKTFVKSKSNSLGVWFDDKKWKNKSEQINEDSEFTFSLINDDGCVIMINEGVGLPSEFMKEVITTRLEEVLDDYQLVCEENRIINNLPVTYYEIHGKTSGIDICLMHYVYSNEDETTQLVAYTMGKKIHTIKHKLEDFLNGLSK
ncbi:hypothetical protein N9Y92_03350 [Chlamydiales bacterium]|nr:hypothetical protein [Chlamydiales bacterium]